jgi:hypothetical protein
MYQKLEVFVVFSMSIYHNRRRFGLSETRGQAFIIYGGGRLEQGKGFENTFALRRRHVLATTPNGLFSLIPHHDTRIARQFLCCSFTFTKRREGV